MSPDEIFAAQMWPWPDPLIKRDPMGRVLFLNAAFLQLYGGRVESWTGQIIQGWPAPNPQGLPYRFETRAGEGEYEIVYDWLEVTMADGNALAIARDVTCFQPQPYSASAPEYVPEAPAHGAMPAQQSAPITEAAPAIAQAPIQAPVQAPAQSAVHAPQHAPQAQPQYQSEPAPQQAAPAPQTPPPAAAPVTPELSVPQMQVPEINVPDISAAPQTPPVAEQPQPAQPADIAPAPQSAQSPAPEIAENLDAIDQKLAEAEAEPKREYARRALPIEDGDSVLGTNWRDAVIAKAVGADRVPPAEEAQDDETAFPSTQSYESEDEDDDMNAEGALVGEGLKILLAEDNAINALLTRTLLEAEGCHVETVEDGALAVKAVEKNDYDLIFMDMRMPNMDGLEATRKIRAMGARTEKLPIIALTANAFDDDRNACFDSGMNDFMTKPVSAEELTEMVTNWALKDKANAAKTEAA